MKVVAISLFYSLVVAISCEQNVVSHELVKRGCTGPRMTVWLRSGTEEIVKLCVADRTDPV